MWENIRFASVQHRNVCTVQSLPTKSGIDIKVPAQPDPDLPSKPTSIEAEQAFRAKGLLQNTLTYLLIIQKVLRGALMCWHAVTLDPLAVPFGEYPIVVRIASRASTRSGPGLRVGYPAGWPTGAVGPVSHDA